MRGSGLFDDDDDDEDEGCCPRYDNDIPYMMYIRDLARLARYT